ncbi:MAG: WS/DGAT domain-containing protein, partial [Sulfuritalea sp.]|nr:WS/DGAT domain-containing protein [Sulfuritalea sp.]
FLQKGESVRDVEVRAMIPVNLRTAKHEGTLGNRFGLGTLSLPVHEGNPFARLFLVRQRMNELKGSYQPPLTMALLGAVGIAPKILQQQFLDILAAKASTVMTNVPGPRQPLYLAGSRLDELMFWVPQSGDIGIGVSILSYNDNVQFGLITDRNFVPDPETIAPLFAAEFEKMLLALLMLDWDQPFDAAQVEQQLFGKLLAPPLSAAGAKPKTPARPRKTAQAKPAARPAAAVRPGKTAAASAPTPAAVPAAAAATRVPKRFRNLA